MLIRWSDGHYRKGLFGKNREDIFKSLALIKYHGEPIIVDEESVCEDANAFLHGLCHVFSFALNQKMGYKCYEIRTHEGACVHWFCEFLNKARTVYADIRGLTTNFEDVISEFPICKNVKCEIISQNIENFQFESEIDEIAYQFACDIIEKYGQMYKA